MNLTVLVSVFFIVTFVLKMIFGKGIENWDDWFVGLAFGLAIHNISVYSRENKNTRKKRVN